MASSCDSPRASAGDCAGVSPDLTAALGSFSCFTATHSTHCHRLVPAPCLPPTRWEPHFPFPRGVRGPGEVRLCRLSPPGQCGSLQSPLCLLVHHSRCGGFVTRLRAPVPPTGRPPRPLHRGRHPSPGPQLSGPGSGPTGAPVTQASTRSEWVTAPSLWPAPSTE